MTPDECPRCSADERTLQTHIHVVGAGEHVHDICTGTLCGWMPQRHEPVSYTRASRATCPDCVRAYYRAAID